MRLQLPGRLQKYFSCFYRIEYFFVLEPQIVLAVGFVHDFLLLLVNVEIISGVRLVALQLLITIFNSLHAVLYRLLVVAQLR